MRKAKDLYGARTGEKYEDRVINENKVKVPCPGFYKGSEDPKDDCVLGVRKIPGFKEMGSTAKDARPK